MREATHRLLTIYPGQRRQQPFLWREHCSNLALNLRLGHFEM